MSELVNLKEFLAGFVAEAEEHIASATLNLTATERSLSAGQSNPRAARELFRSLHTIKGLSAMVGVEPIVDISHAMETVLRNADAAGGRLTPGMVELLIRGVRAIDDRVSALSRNVAVKPAPRSLLEAFAALDPSLAVGAEVPEPTLALEPALLSKLTAAEKQQFVVAVAAGARALRVDFAPSPKRVDGLDITTVRERLGRVADIVRVLPQSIPASELAPGGLSFALLLTSRAPNELIAEAAGAAPDSVIVLWESDASGGADAAASQATGAGNEGGEEDADDVVESNRGTFVRVDVVRLDGALENLSSLVVTRFKLLRAVSNLAARGADVRELSTIVTENGRQLRDLRASLMRMRVVTARSLLDRVPLIVAGLSRKTGKPVRLEMDAGEAELDKSVAERIFPAIVHLVRNAIDHGIESPLERSRAGKPEEGLLRIVCSARSNNQLELTITDDGRGMDRVAVARRAGATLPDSDAALLDLIIRPGVSTVDDVTTTSGRGVGMDIVKRTVTSELGGELRLRTTPGAGSTFTVRIPLTITIVDAFSFICGGERFVTPVGAIEEILDVDPALVVHTPRVRTGQRSTRMLQRRGEALPLLGLDEVFGLTRQETALRKALVVRRDERSVAFEVEQMLGQQEVVVRPLEDPLVRVTGISGSTDLGDGRPTLVLDLVALTGTLWTGEGARA